MSENPLKLSGSESYHEILIAKAVEAANQGGAEGLDDALETVKAERKLPHDSKDSTLGSDGQAYKKLAGKLDDMLKSQSDAESSARNALNVMISRATVRNKLSALLSPDDEGESS